MEEKKSIYFIRTYRRLKKNIKGSILYICFLVLPVMVLFILNINNITRLMSQMAVKILGQIYPGTPLYIREEMFSILATIEYVELPTVYPEAAFILINFVMTLFLAIFLNTGRRKGKPLSVYFFTMLLIHLINCIYFIFAANYFPYTSTQYSILYINQQIAIWLAFIVLTGLITGFLGSKALFYRILTFFSILFYSLIYGTIRYVLFLFVIQEFSMIYMALLYFALGPFFDFLYLVFIYGIYINKMIKIYDLGYGRGEWLWS